MVKGVRMTEETELDKQVVNWILRLHSRGLTIEGIKARTRIREGLIIKVIEANVMKDHNSLFEPQNE